MQDLTRRLQTRGILIISGGITVAFGQWVLGDILCLLAASLFIHFVPSREIHCQRDSITLFPILRQHPCLILRKVPCQEGSLFAPCPMEAVLLSNLTIMGILTSELSILMLLIELGRRLCTTLCHIAGFTR